MIHSGSGSTAVDMDVVDVAVLVSLGGTTFMESGSECGSILTLSLSLFLWDNFTHSHTHSLTHSHTHSFSLQAGD
jgi:hypothetical protein